MCVVVAVVVRGKADHEVAFDEYRKEMTAGGFPVFDKRLFWRAYCSVLDAGTLEAPQSVVRAVLKDEDSCKFPTYLCRWGSTWLD
jgi:hypothetical protein